MYWLSLFLCWTSQYVLVVFVSVLDISICTGCLCFWLEISICTGCLCFYVGNLNMYWLSLFLCWKSSLAVHCSLWAGGSQAALTVHCSLWAGGSQAALAVHCSLWAGGSQAALTVHCSLWAGGSQAVLTVHCSLWAGGSQAALTVHCSLWAGGSQAACSYSLFTVGWWEPDCLFIFTVHCGLVAARPGPPQLLPQLQQSLHSQHATQPEEWPRHQRKGQAGNCGSAGHLI